MRSGRSGRAAEKMSTKAGRRVWGGQAAGPGVNHGHFKPKTREGGVGEGKRWDWGTAGRWDRGGGG